MPLVIENITGEPYPPDSADHRYVVRVNRRPLASFSHRRDRGHASLLRAAADAIDAHRNAADGGSSNEGGE